MIRNEKEYRSTKAALAGYEGAVTGFNVFKSIESGIDPVIARAQHESYKRQAAELEEKVRAYEALRDGETAELDVDSVAELGPALIKARVASGLTQRELANMAGLQEQQIQKYEKELYGSANLRRLAHIAATIGVKLEAQLKLQPIEPGTDEGLPAGLSLAHFPFAEMNSRGWLSGDSDLRRAPPNEKSRALCAFFAQVPAEVRCALHRKSGASESPARTAALLAWQARILIKARQKSGLARHFKTPPADVIAQLAKFSSEPDGVKKAVDLLLEYGIIVVFERHLPKTKLDGAAMSLDGQFAVIGMTLRYDRIDNFWFVLLHELGHIMRHWHKMNEGGFIDEEAGESDEIVEREANEFAEHAILPKMTWLASAVRFTKLPGGIREFAARHGIHPALVAGRIRKERGYTEFADMLGSGEVRAVLRSEGLME